MTTKRGHFYQEVERMREVYSRFPLGRLRQIVRTGSIKEYVTAAKQVLREREKSGQNSK